MHLFCFVSSGWGKQESTGMDGMDMSSYRIILKKHRKLINSGLNWRDRRWSLADIISCKNVTTRKQIFGVTENFLLKI